VSATFDLTLDTHAPQVTWGEPTGTEAGDELHVPYTIDEPAVVSASVHLADGRDLAMVVSGTELVVTLPADAPNGVTVVSAFVRDDVLNEATRTLSFAIGGVVTPPAPPPLSGGMPEAPSRGPNRRLVRIRSVAEASTRLRIRASHERLRSTVNVRSAIRIERRVAEVRTAVTVRKRDDELPLLLLDLV
jgi:hypothetical protein